MKSPHLKMFPSFFFQTSGITTAAVRQQTQHYRECGNKKSKCTFWHFGLLAFVQIKVRRGHTLLFERINVYSSTHRFVLLMGFFLHRQGDNKFKQVEHITDVSNATATGFFDPFTLQWADWAKKLFGVDVSLLKLKVQDGGFIF
jgi:hypothetical protein